MKRTNRRTRAYPPSVGRLGAIGAIGLLLAAGAARAGESGATAKAPPADGKETAAARAAREAHRILGNLKTTRYSHKTAIDEAKGSYEADCSGLATVILRAAAPRSLAGVPRSRGWKRPRAFEFYAAFAGAPADKPGPDGWQRIARLADARPGDFIAWRVKEVVAGKSTGHIVMVDAPPIRENDGQLRVVIVESAIGHGADDSRPEGVTGVGRCTVWFTTDAKGGPVAYRRKGLNDRLRRTPRAAVGRPVDPD